MIAGYMRVIEIDKGFFLRIQDNLVGESPVLDRIFLAIARYTTFFFAAVLGCLVIYILVSRKAYLLKRLAVLAAAIAMPVSIAYFGRPLIGRPRPFLVLDFEPLLGYQGTVSFPSNHAAAAFAIAMAVYAYNRKAGAALLTAAAIASFARVYVGVHYPLDIIAGSFLGIVIVWAMLSLPKWLHKKNRARQGLW